MMAPPQSELPTPTSVDSVASITPALGGLDGLPLVLQEVVQLHHVGINAANIGFNTLTLESDKFVCVREKVGETSQVVIIDLADPYNPVRRPISADSAIMHPINKIIALKAARQLQIFNLELKSKVKSFSMEEEVLFWKWVTPQLLGLVTATAVFHWSLDDTLPDPVKVFDRHASLSDTQIINYRLSHDETWAVLIGISAQQGRVVGAMQLYSRERNVSQPIEGHAAAFAELLLENQTSVTRLFAFAVRNAQGAGRVQMVEIDHTEGLPVYTKKSVELVFPPELPNDFPVAMQISARFGVLYLVTKYGYFHVYDLETATLLLMNRISADTIFVTTEAVTVSGLVGVNRKGQVLSVTLDDQRLVPYLVHTLNAADLAIKMASRANLPHADDLFVLRFNQLFQQQQFTEAARVAALSPEGVLRTPQTIERFKQVPLSPGQTSPLLQYFGILLERGQLNVHESLELAKPVLAQGRTSLLEKWLKEDKLACSEALGDLTRQYDVTLALSVYLRANSPAQVIECFAETGQLQNIVLYANKVNYQPDYMQLLTRVLTSAPDKAAEFAVLIATDVLTVSGSNATTHSDLSVDHMVDLFMQQQQVQPCTSFLLDILKADREEDGALQTRLLEMNLLHAPQVADAMLAAEMFSHYDRAHIAVLCERAGLYQRALEHDTELADIQRHLAHAADQLSPDWLVAYFGRLSVEQSLACLAELLLLSNSSSGRSASSQKLVSVVVQIAAKYSDQLNAHHLIELFESHKVYDGLFFYLGSVVHASEDAEVHFKYIQAACRQGHTKEVERMCRESRFYDAERVKNLLKEAHLQDQLPLIIVCDRFGFIQDLVMYLYKNQLHKYIEVYIQRVNPARTPSVLGALMDLDCSDDALLQLLDSVSYHGSAAAPPYAMSELVEEMERRNRLQLLTQLLERCALDKTADPAVYNALAKIYIETNSAPEAFLRSNTQYDCALVGKFCEKRDPYLAIIAYEKGHCDMELLHLTSDNAMFKQQARYLVHRQQADVWAYALRDDNPHRRPLIDAVIQTALPETRDPEDVSVAVKAFMSADLPNELIELLEKLVLADTPHNTSHTTAASSSFRDNRNLQNLLILTAIKADHERVAGYVSQLNNYDAPDIASIAVQSGLYEEAFAIYAKYREHVKAIQVLLVHIGALDRAQVYAEQVQQHDVYSQLARAQLDAYLTRDAMLSYRKANDPSHYIDVIAAAERDDAYAELVEYLTMARKRAREPYIESELIFALAKTNALATLEEVIAAPHLAQIQAVGDRCYDEKLYEAAKILFTHIHQHARLASTLVHLGEFPAAVESARRANAAKVWKEVCFACLQAGETRLAQLCGTNLVVKAEELEFVVQLYEQRAEYALLMQLLEAALASERAHVGLFTELAVCYTKYAPEKTMAHLKVYAQHRLATARVVRACEEAHLYAEQCFLLVQDEQYDAAVQCMLDHHPSAWQHSVFKDALAKCTHTEWVLRALQDYYEMHPAMLNDLLSAVSHRVDAGKVVALFQQRLPLIESYLLSMQHQNLRAVNEALQQLFLQEDNDAALKDAVDTYTNYDAMALAQQLERHARLSFRRIAAHLYRKQKKYALAMQIALHDRLMRDAIETAAESREATLCEQLLQSFLDLGDRECFMACLYTCYEVVRPDVVLELTWRHRMVDFMMPFMMQSLRDMHHTVSVLERAENARQAQEAEQERLLVSGQAPQQRLITSYGAATAASHSDHRMLLQAPQQQGVVSVQPTYSSGFHPQSTTTTPFYPGYSS